MEPHIKTEANSTASNDCIVSLLDVCELEDKDYTTHLSAEETAQYMVLPNESRKREWLAGRLSAKYLFLNRRQMSRATRSRPSRPGLWKLSSEALAVYSPRMYQRVEVRRNGGRPNLVWCGKDRRESISLSHKGSVSCASLAVGAITAIDIETAIPRSEAFYTNTFSEAERAWATRGAGVASLSSNWAFTLLWTMKESVVKLGGENRTSLWNLPRIEIDGLPGLNEIGPFWRGCTLDDDFVVFTARVREQCREMQVQVAVTGTRNLVLTVMSLLIGATN